MDVEVDDVVPLLVAVMARVVDIIFIMSMSIDFEISAVESMIVWLCP